MNLSFYTAGVSAAAQQEKLNVVANNIANVNNDGYKALKTEFSGLLYQNVREPEPAVSEARHGVGAKAEKTDINFNPGPVAPTNYPLDFGITGEGFFAVRDPATTEVFYTRTGSFQMSRQANGQFYLAAPTGEHVLGPDMQPIVLQTANDDGIESKIGVFAFNHYEGFVSDGKNFYTPDEKNGAPVVNQNALVRKGVVEMSNVETAKEFTDMITAQRLYQMSLRMVTTSDEIEATINSLRR